LLVCGLGEEMDGRPNWISSWMADEDMARPRRTPHTNGGVDEEQGESSGDKAGGCCAEIGMAHRVTDDGDVATRVLVYVHAHRIINKCTYIIPL
jgi:hypothetical protein